jgi:hypothetical protein
MARQSGTKAVLFADVSDSSTLYQKLIDATARGAGRGAGVIAFSYDRRPMFRI